MYDDPVAVKKFGELIEEFKIQSVFETGTWKGIGTLWLLEYVDEVYTAEIDPIFYVQACENWKTKGYKEISKLEKDEIEYKVFEKDNKTIHAFYGDSAEAMDYFLTEHKEKVKRPCLFYLDAHWDWNQPQLIQFWPILREFEVLAKHKMSDSVIIVHDVKHPTKDFGYDDFYDEPLDLNYMKEGILSVNPDYKTYHNDEVGNEESGRGILYITP